MMLPLGRLRASAGATAHPWNRIVVIFGVGVSGGQVT